MIARLFASALLNTSRNTPVLDRSAGISVFARQPPLAYSSKLSPGLTEVLSPVVSIPIVVPAAATVAMSFCSSPWLQAATVARRAASSRRRVMASLSRNIVYDRWTTPRAGPTPAASLPARTRLAGPQKYRGKDQGTAMRAPLLDTKLSPETAQFRANPAHNRALADRLPADVAHAALGGSEKGPDRHDAHTQERRGGTEGVRTGRSEEGPYK